jgi:hypothetical protein
MRQTFIAAYIKMHRPNDNGIKEFGFVRKCLTRSGFFFCFFLFFVFLDPKVRLIVLILLDSGSCFARWVS